MTTELGTEDEIIEHNAEYVLGMYDMYHNDEEIVTMLRMKGLNEGIVQKILLKIKKPAYEKRVRQAKRMILLASLLIVLLVIVPYIIVVLSGGSTDVFLNPDSIEYDREREGMIFVYFKYLLSIALYVIIAAAIQFGVGIYSLIKYKRLLKSTG